MGSASAARAARFGSVTRGVHAVPLSNTGLGDGAPKSIGAVLTGEESGSCLDAAQRSDVWGYRLVQQRHRGTCIPAAVVSHE